MHETVRYDASVVADGIANLRCQGVVFKAFAKVIFVTRHWRSNSSISPSITSSLFYQLHHGIYKLNNLKLSDLETNAAN